MTQQMSTNKSIWKHKHKFEVDNRKYSSIRDYVESATPYLFSDYNLFRKNTGIRINSQETAEQFLSYMQEKKKNKHKERFSGPVFYKGKDYKTLTSLFKTLKCTKQDYSNYKLFSNGSTIKNEEDVYKFVKHLKEKNKKEQKNEQIAIEYNNIQHKSIAALLKCLGFKVPQYAYYRTKTGNNIRNAEDVETFLSFMKTGLNGNFKKSFKIKYDDLDFRSRQSLLNYLGYSSNDYIVYNERTGQLVTNAREVDLFLKDMISKGKYPIEKSKRIPPSYMQIAS